jgi:hypothetical protein
VVNRASFCIKGESFIRLSGCVDYLLFFGVSLKDMRMAGADMLDV